MEGAAARALASLPGRTGVPATSQDGKQLLCDPFELDGLTAAGLPAAAADGRGRAADPALCGRRPAVDGAVRADRGRVPLVRAGDRRCWPGRDQRGRRRPAGGAGGAAHTGGDDRDLLPVRRRGQRVRRARRRPVGDRGCSSRSSCRWSAGDEFAVTFTLEERKITIQAKAVKADMGAYGRVAVGARITRVSDRDLLAITAGRRDRRVAPAPTRGLTSLWRCPPRCPNRGWWPRSRPSTWSGARPSWPSPGRSRRSRRFR